MEERPPTVEFEPREWSSRKRRTGVRFSFFVTQDKVELEERTHLSEKPSGNELACRNEWIGSNSSNGELDCRQRARFSLNQHVQTHGQKGGGRAVRTT